MPDATPSTPTPDASEYERERRDKAAKLRELGVDPFGGRTENVRALASVRDQFKQEFGQDGGPVVTVAGRVMLKRDMGKLSFLTLRDETGDLQIALDKRRVDDLSWQVRGLIDLGDQIVATGPLGSTNKGEVTVWATGVTMAAKALLPPPAKWEGLSDKELRYRQRYVDLWANPEGMAVLKKRSQIIESMRQFLIARGFTEVETPMLQPIHGGAAARPFETHHNALDLPLYLRIAPELYLKRLLVGGMGKVFEINRNFRNEGISPRHNPEFTMIEAYEAFGSWETMAELVEEMVCHVAMEVLGTLEIHHGGHGEHGGEERVINLKRPWRRVSMVELVEERTGWRFDKRPLKISDPDLHQAMIANRYGDLLEWGKELARRVRYIGEFELEEFRSRVLQAADVASNAVTNDDITQTEVIKQDGGGIQISRSVTVNPLSPEQELVEVYEKLIEPTLVDPCFVTRVPSVIIPLAKPCADDPYFADVYELAINGQEISPGYTELNDPDRQAEQFRRQVGEAAERQAVDEDFLAALKYGMPPAGGMGLGIDRLVMLLLGAESIRDVIAFPLMRPEK